MGIRPMGRTLLVLAAGAALLAGCGDKKNNSAAPAPVAPTTAAAEASAAPSSAAPTALPDNGVAKLDAKTILSRAKTALKEAKSFRVKGTSPSGGQKVDFDFEVRGKDVLGTVTVQKAKLQLLQVGGKRYMKPDEAGWKLFAGSKGAAMAQLMNGRWTTVPASEKSLVELFSVTDIDQLLAPDGKLTKGSTKAIAGTPAVGLVDHASDGGTIWVATAGQPYPLRYEPSKASGGGMTISDFGATFADLKAPAASEVVDISKLGG